ncbi:alpha/beta fold hydrolase [Aureimonas jatrophae]|uniref:Pimeloyl-ACP methyl ester carboxylesterase n=1 Tax=Aureimonas jatrophae TaxID=1166073 RepID=A0A1H0JMK2_9HYPH|nr:alpha/beta hydrolase [Aureimonas jatrophae]MBB3951336.1 pimeloyl-ACP methyl ester carboxylesterase [Aureimonas jatrophae]SDO44743.1 Pimeloyl-ACP methyl ester carboxylesterase [Aureimonas jatrophae]
MTDRFHSGGFELAFIDEGESTAPVVVLVHGFASSLRINWVDPSWVATLVAAGFRVLAFDHRGHGDSDKPLDPEQYTPQHMADDMRALLDARGVRRAAAFGYSMGARVSAFAALSHAERWPVLVFGGLGIGLVHGVGDWDPIVTALLAPALGDVSDERGRMFRAFADRTHSNRQALAACITHSRRELSRDEVARITQPVLVGVGTRDDIAGSPGELADLLPAGEAFAIEKRDHMLAVGDRTFKAAVVEFLSRHKERFAP